MPQDGAEWKRLAEARERRIPWRKWGPYLSERQWGTVREDYSDTGDAWSYFSHEQARSRAYHWGEDGLAGFSDEKQRLCFALALWNGRDAILKERLFGLTNAEGNHGEDVKEYYFYLDSTPTHSYMKWLYKYPQAAYPYRDLVEGNRHRSRVEFAYELLDAGVFDQDRYWDVIVEYAKADPEDILIRITATNRGPDAATLHVLPTLWFRNTWTWWPDTPKPGIQKAPSLDGIDIIAASHSELGGRWLSLEGHATWLFTENDTNAERLFGKPNAGRFVKDGIHRYVVEGCRDAVNPAETGTKAAAHHQLLVESGASAGIRLRLTDRMPGSTFEVFGDFTSVLDARRQEADTFYRELTPPATGADAANVMRQAYAGLLWSKQYYSLDAERWLKEHGASMFDQSSRTARNRNWAH